MKFTVYGPGCPNCKEVAENSKQAAEELGIDIELEKIEDINQMVDAGVITTPGLAIDGEVKVTGRVPNVKEIKELID